MRNNCHQSHWLPKGRRGKDWLHLFTCNWQMRLKFISSIGACIWNDSGSFSGLVLLLNQGKSGHSPRFHEFPRSFWARSTWCFSILNTTLKSYEGQVHRMGLNWEQTLTRMRVKTSTAESGGMKKWKGEYKAPFVASLVTCGHDLATSIQQAVWQ